MSMPAIPEGTGKHPVSLVVISANDLATSMTFYTNVFGWQMTRLSDELAMAPVPSGPVVVIRANVPEGFPSHVPYIQVPNVAKALQEVVATGCSIERAPWSMPMMGSLARFTDESGTIYGLSDALMPGGAPSIPMPFGDNAKPHINTICSLEMYSAGETPPRFARELFGWGTLPTMPQFVGFNPGAGIGGVFQSHTPSLPAVAYIYVSDVSSALRSIGECGGQKLGEAMPMPGMATFGYFKDSSGSTMGLIGP